MLFGNELVTQLPDAFLRAIVDKSLILKTTKDIMELGVTSEVQASEILDCDVIVCMLHSHDHIFYVRC